MCGRVRTPNSNDILKYFDLVYKGPYKDMQQHQSIPGMGKKTALWLIVNSGGFTKFENSKQLSSYIACAQHI